MQSKYFEIRDRGTMIIARADKFTMDTPEEKAFLRKGGWSIDYPDVILTTLSGGVHSEYDPYQWMTGSRTIPDAHFYIRGHFDELPNYAVIDVEYINGETSNPKESEVFDW